MSDGARGGNLPLILAIIAVVGVVGMGAYLIGSGSSDDGSKQSADRSDSGGNTTVIVEDKDGSPGRRRQGEGAESDSTSVPASDGWPAGTSAYTIVLASTGDRAAAQSAASRASGIGGPTGVLHSDDYSSLRPGYWVAFAGTYATSDYARSAAGAYRAAGFSDAYVRYVSNGGETPNATSSNGWPAYTVVLASAGARSTADSAAARASSAGLGSSGVLHSDDYSSLRAGYWVAYLGQYARQAEARSVATRARSAGFGDAYVRFVSP